MLKRTFSYTGAIALLGLICFAASQTGAGGFFSQQNLATLCQQAAILALLAIGLTPIIAAGSIDLSIGGVVGLISIAIAGLHGQILPSYLEELLPATSIATKGLVNTGLTLGAALLLGMVIGTIQGGIIAGGRRSAWLVTFGGLLAGRAMTLAFSREGAIDAVEPSLRYCSGGYLTKTAGLGLACLLLAGLVLLLEIRQRKLDSLARPSPDFGRNLWAVALGLVVIILNVAGILPNGVVLLAVAALFVGTLTGATGRGDSVFLFAMMGGLCGLAAILRFGQLGGGGSGSGQYYEVDALTACMIGAIALRGGPASISGAILGSLIVAVLVNGLQLGQIPVGWQMLLRGGLLFGLIAYYKNHDK